MATVKRTPVAATSSDLVKIWKWAGLTQADANGAEPLGPEWLDYVDRTVQVTGTFGGATIVLEGSNDGTNFVTLNAPGNSALSFTSAGLKQILESAAYIRPNISGGAGVSVDITVCARRATRGTV